MYAAACETIRRPMFSGLFYPVDSATLDATIQQCLRGQHHCLAARPRILIVPHAGYVLSGRVAGAGFAQVRDSSTIILLGVAHRRGFDAVAAYCGAYWQTPLGRVTVGRSIISALTSTYPAFCVDNDAHKYEHTLEVQLPFLQTILKDFHIVPLLLGNLHAPAALSNVIARIFDDETLLVVSSDLAHYPSQADAEVIDRHTIEAILSSDDQYFQQVIFNQMHQGFPGLSTCACGTAAIEVALQVAQLLHCDKPYLLAYQNSGQVTGNPRRVVGYASIAFT